MSVTISIRVVDMPEYLELGERKESGDPDAFDEWADLVEQRESYCDFSDSFSPVDEIVLRFEAKQEELEGTPEARFLRTIFWKALGQPRPGIEPSVLELALHAQLLLGPSHLAEMAEDIRRVDLERLASTLFDTELEYLESEADFVDYLGQFRKALLATLESEMGFVYAIWG